MFKGVKKLYEFVKLGNTMNYVSAMLIKIVGEYEAEKPFFLEEYTEEIYLLAYITRIGILDRMDKNDWPLEGPIRIPALNSSNVTLLFAYSRTVLLLKNFTSQLEISPIVEQILNKDELFYQFEKMISPKDLKFIQDKI
jgi:hypothetical protein